MNKSFTTKKPTEVNYLTITPEGGTEAQFQLKPSIPGDTLLDFISAADTDNPSAMAKAVRELLYAGIVEAQHEEFKAFIRNPEHNVTLDDLSEYAGYIAEVLSGNSQQPVPFGAG